MKKKVLSFREARKLAHRLKEQTGKVFEVCFAEGLGYYLSEALPSAGK